MRSGNQFNEATVEWQKSGINIDTGQIPAFTASTDDVTTFRQDGVVLLAGVFTEWVETLRDGLQRNLDNPQQFAFPCESNPAGSRAGFSTVIAIGS